MSAVQGWVFQLCVVCILVSVIITFIKNEKLNSGIKTVLAIYILLTAVMPLQNNRFNLQEQDNIIQQQVQAIDADKIIRSKAEYNLIMLINDELKSEEINAECINVILDESMTTVKSVIIKGTTKTDFNEIIITIKNIVGEDAEVKIQKEG